MSRGNPAACGKHLDIVFVVSKLFQCLYYDNLRGALHSHTSFGNTLFSFGMLVNEVFAILIGSLVFMRVQAFAFTVLVWGNL